MVNKIHFNKKPILNEDVSWLIGFYLAEGLKKSRDSIGLANKEYELILKSIGIFEKYFWIKKEDWKVFIKTDEKNKDRLRSILNRWNDKLNMVTKSSYSSLAKKQAVDIRINSRVINKFFKNYMNKSINSILNNKNLSGYFLRGYFVGDGSPNRRGEQIHSIVITTKDKEHLRFLTEIMKLCFNKSPNIRMTKGSYEIYYCDMKIITEAVLSKIFIDSKKQWAKLIYGYKNKQYTRARIKYWNKIKNKPLRASEIAILSGNSHWSVSDALNKDIKLGLVKAEFIKKENRPGPPNKYYSLTTKGLNLVNLIEV